LMPNDAVLAGGLGNAYERVDESLVESQLILAVHFGGQMVDLGSRWNRVYPRCISTTGIDTTITIDNKPAVHPDDCLRGFIEKYGKMMYRRPLLRDEIDRHVDAFHSSDSLS